MTWFRAPVFFDYRDGWPPSHVIHAKRRHALLKARSIRNALIEQQLLNPRARKAVTKVIAEDPRSGFARAAAKLFKLAIKEIR